LDIGRDPTAPIILGRPFLSTTKAIIYADNAKICFTINDRKVRFTFKYCKVQSPNMSQVQFLTQEAKGKKKNQRARKSKAIQPKHESVGMIDTSI
jgi:4-hydroxyphenylpyruvate dioxygenase-like putative hemolysin